MIKDENYILSNGVLIPKVGFGTWQIDDEELAFNSSLEAIKAGYRHIDTAYAYNNEIAIGKAVKASGVKREEIFITTKLPANIKTYEGCKEHFYKSLSNLDLDYIDLYLIHAPWPWSEVGKDCSEGNIEVFKAMIELYEEKKVRSIGVSNFRPSDIENIVNATNFVPHVNQIRYFIGNTEKEVVDYCNEHNILVEAYSPLATGKILEDPKIIDIAKKYNKTVASICLRFCIENNTLPLPKSNHKERIIENLNLDYHIDKEDMDYLNSIINEELRKPYRS